jgi:hypothetical protein
VVKISATVHSDTLERNIASLVSLQAAFLLLKRADLKPILNHLFSPSSSAG